MIMKFSSLKNLSPIIFGAIFLFIFSGQLAAAITLSPPIIDTSAMPGEIITPQVSVSNDSSLPITLSGSVEAFRASSRPGVAEFFPSDTGLPTWINLEEKEILLKPGEGKKIMLTIRVPENVEPGSYYAAVFWSTKSGANHGSGASVTSKLGTLIFLRVAGDATEKLEILSFSPMKNIFWSLPAAFGANVKNTGNVHLIPRGELVIRSFFGKQVAILPWNESGLRVLPGSERKIEQLWGEKNLWEELKAGIWLRYTATLHLSYGAPIKETGDFVSFWFFSWQSLGIAILSLLALFFGIKFAIKKYNRWIIKKHLGR